MPFPDGSSGTMSTRVSSGSRRADLGCDNGSDACRCRRVPEAVEPDLDDQGRERRAPDPLRPRDSAPVAGGCCWCSRGRRSILTATDGAELFCSDDEELKEWGSGVATRQNCRTAPPHDYTIRTELSSRTTPLHRATSSADRRFGRTVGGQPSVVERIGARVRTFLSGERRSLVAVA